LQWLAVNTVDFYNAISVLYGTLAEFCTERNCEVMSAGSKVCIPQQLTTDRN
jgi:MOB kinase activator 1